MPDEPISVVGQSLPKKKKKSKIRKPKGKPEAQWTAEKFWFVQVEKKGHPNFRHPTLASAYEEGKRLAALTKQRTWVFESIGVIEPPAESES